MEGDSSCLFEMIGDRQANGTLQVDMLGGNRQLI